MKKELKEKIRMLEERLIRPEVRGCAEELSELIADDFIEYGSSGREYGKKDILRILPNEPPAKMEIEDFHARSLSPEVVLLNYSLLSHDERSRGVKRTRRSSIWRLTDGRWQIVFHKGTNK
jgi:hypothetical protein